MIVLQEIDGKLNFKDISTTGKSRKSASCEIHWNLILWMTQVRFPKMEQRKGYDMLLEKSDYWEVEWPWKMLWKTKAPTNLACFGWVAAKIACLTQELLQKGGFHLCCLCFLCKRPGESPNHMLLHCVFTWKTWTMFLKILGIQWAMPYEVKSLVLSWQGQNEQHMYKDLERCHFMRHLEYLA